MTNYNWILLAGVVACVVIWAIRRDRRRSREAPNLPPGKAEVAVGVPVLPAGVEGKIVSALRAGREPDELPAPFRGFYMSVSGESFPNNDGSSRQKIIEKAAVGSTVLLVPEPDNKHDSQAIRVFVHRGGTSALQIGYLPREHNIGTDVASSRAACWLARTGKRNNRWGAALYVALKED